MVFLAFHGHERLKASNFTLDHERHPYPDSEGPFSKYIKDKINLVEKFKKNSGTEVKASHTQFAVVLIINVFRLIVEYGQECGHFEGVNFRSRDPFFVLLEAVGIFGGFNCCVFNMSVTLTLNYPPSPQRSVRKAKTKGLKNSKIYILAFFLYFLGTNTKSFYIETIQEPKLRYRA